MANATPTSDPSVSVKCDRYYSEKNRTSIIYGGYEGIPENLLINIIVWLILLILFSVLRKLTRDYGRSASVRGTDARWTSLFHGQDDETGSSPESLDIQDHKQDNGFCSWIPAFFSIKDEQIVLKSGRDAVQYLMFQRYLLVYMACITVLSIVVILPVNFQGDLEGDSQAFGHTTISNIATDSPTLWVHSVFSLVYLVIAALFMHHFRAHLQYEKDEQATRTLLISSIPKCISKDRGLDNMIKQHFQEAYPEAPVQDIQLAHDISKLIQLDKKRQHASECLINSEAIMKQQGGERPTMVPYPCGHLCACCCPKKQVDAIDYYKHEEEQYKEKYEQEKVIASSETLGIAFVTFEDDQVAAGVFSDFEFSCKGGHKPYPSSVSQQLGVNNWAVKYAVARDNIIWENLSTSLAVWWFKAILINLVVFILLFFLTTPSIILSLISQTDYEESVHSPILVQFLPTLILLAASALLPLLVIKSAQWVGHWTRSTLHHAVMRKCFIFLLLMILVLPSLGLTSASALITWFADHNEDNYKFRWECIFIPGNYAFFVNYVITSAFIGTALQLIRFPELFMYSIKVLFASSGAERRSAWKSVVQEFQFGSQYAWMLCIFSVVMAYSIVCPLITPFGLVYLLMKHMVDRYNICFAYTPSKIDQKIHASAVNFVIIAVIFLQCTVVFFNILRTEGAVGISIFSMVALILTLVLYTMRICFSFSLTRKKYNETELPEVHMPVDTRPFIPDVLLSEGGEPETEEGVVNNMASATYGSTGPPNSAAHDQVHYRTKDGSVQA